MKKKKIYSVEEKTIILREHLENKVPISDLAEKYGLHPNALYKWKKQLFEQAPLSLARRSSSKEKQKTAQERRIAELEGLLQIREGLITELVRENIELKKKAPGTALGKNGLNLKSGIKW